MVVRRPSVPETSSVKLPSPLIREPPIHDVNPKHSLHVRTNVPLLITLPAIARDFAQLLRASLIPIAHLLRRFRDPLVDAQLFPRADDARARRVLGRFQFRNHLL